MSAGSALPLRGWLPESIPQRLLAAFVVISIACILGGIATESIELMLVPAALVILAFAIVDFRVLFYMLFFFIPLSIEVELPGGLGTDLPTEPLMWILTACSFAWILRNWHQVNGRFLRSPITVLMLMHLGWIAVTSVSSEQVGFSVKFFAAKIWYVTTFFFLAIKLLNSAKNIRIMVWAVAVPLLLTIIYVSARHAQHGFSFEMSNKVMNPFYRNHVIYACLPAIFVPYLWFTVPYYKEQPGKKWFLIIVIIATLFAINFAYTRAAYVALLAAALMYYVIKWKKTKLVLTITTIFLGVLIGLVTYKDNYFLFAPDFNRTVTHKKFENLLEATTKLEDISTMERVYRWVAAARMIEKKPYLGYGPGNFYSFYKNFTVTDFQTYVSDNPERSGIHNYFLMTTVEQGVPGLFFFLLLAFSVLIIGERTWHTMPASHERNMVMAATLSFLMLLLLMLMNDLVETDKLGSFFFVSMAIIVSLSPYKQKTIQY